MSYDAIADEFKALNISGEVDEEGLELTYPLYRTSKANLYWSAKMDNRTYGTEVSGTSVKDSLIKSQSIELSGNLFDDILGGGANAANLSYSRGDLGGFGVLPSMIGDYSIYNYSLSRQQAFNEN